MTLTYAVTLVSLTLYAYSKPNIPKSLTLFPFIFFDSLAVWYGTSLYLIAFANYYLSHLYLKYRFNQVREKFNECDDYISYISIMREHDEICRLNAANNRFMSKILFVTYYFTIPILDFTVYNLIYVDFFLIRFLFILCCNASIFSLSISLYLCFNVCFSSFTIRKIEYTYASC